MRIILLEKFPKHKKRFKKKIKKNKEVSNLIKKLKKQGSNTLIKKLKK